MWSINVLARATFAVLLIPNASVVAEDKSSQNAASYLPSLGNIMTAVQLRHSKLWYAVKEPPSAGWQPPALSSTSRSPPFSEAARAEVVV
jgi:hypothetical protein